MQFAHNISLSEEEVIMVIAALALAYEMENLKYATNTKYRHQKFSYYLELLNKFEVIAKRESPNKRLPTCINFIAKIESKKAKFIHIDDLVLNDSEFILLQEAVKGLIEYSQYELENKTEQLFSFHYVIAKKFTERNFK
jgi:hypothetical protein